MTGTLCMASWKEEVQNVAVGERHSVHTVILPGRSVTLNAESLPSLERLLPLLADTTVLLDCRNVACVTAAGLGGLMKLHRKLGEVGGGLALVNVVECVREVLAVTRLDTMLKVL